MKSYTIHEAPEPSVNTMDKADRIEFVREGFAWLALFFPIVWMIYYRMWIVLAVFVGFMFALQGITYTSGAQDEIAGLISIFASLVFAFEANNLRRWTIERQGYQLVGAINGDSYDECELKFFSSWLGREQEASNLTKIATKAMHPAPAVY